MSLPQPAIDNLIKIEGGYAEPPAVEQPCKYGINQVEWIAWLNTLESIGSYPPSIQDITQKQASDFMLSRWWGNWGFDKITDQNVCNFLFQSCYLAGMQTGIEQLQIALDSIGATIPSLRIDGILGDDTLSVLNALDAVAVLPALRNTVARHYLGIVQSNPSKKDYLEGWMNRALNL